MEDLSEYIKDLEAQRDELLAIIRVIVESDDEGEWDKAFERGYEIVLGKD